MSVTGQLAKNGRPVMGIISHASDRRHNSRFTMHLEVGFTIVDEKTSARITSYHQAVLVNRSSGGCCLIVDRLQFEGFHLMKCIESVKLYHLLVSLGNRHGNAQPFELKGFIRWIHDMKEGAKEGFLVGIELSPADEEPSIVPGKRVIGHS